MITVAPHPILEPAAFVTRFPGALATMPSPDWLKLLLALDAPFPMRSDDGVRAAVRDLLRSGGFKPTGRSKPASEYLLRAVADGALGSINVAVDACNVTSLHSGMPISVVDLSRGRSPWSISTPAAPASYVFNAAGQEIDIAGLLCLCDADGPCANAVKDAQRTKTTPETTETLSVVWGTRALSGRADETARQYRALLERAGATTLDAPLIRPA